MRWILYILAFLALLVLAGFLLPREVATERSVYIAKPPAAVFPYLNNFRNFNSWSPWYQLDPQTQYEYSGPAEGVGATMSWRSENPNVGTGSQTITASEPDSLVRTDLDFGDQGSAVAEFKLQPQGSGTNVTWSFSTDMGSGPIARWMGLLVKRMVGQSYESGLNKLKNLVESAETPAPESDIDNGSDSELPAHEGQPDDGAEDGGMEINPGDTNSDGGEILEEESEEPIEESP